MSLDAAAGPLQVDPLIDDPNTRIIVCCGAGGVGKTTTAAALGVRAAERGRRVVVLTIDPARRLAQSLGIDSLDNTPRRVKGIEQDGTGPAGELHAMMLDMKRTFDEIVEAHADAERARAILENPFYQSLSAGFAGTQEYMAMEKLGQLRARDEWDLIVVDTPPSRSALDFLDAPKRLGSFLDGKFIKLLVTPAKMGGRAGMKFLNVGMSMMTGTLGKLLGGQLLRDVQTFVTAMDTMFGGFRTRADATYRLLQAPGTAFLVVAAPERDALREAAYFVERLAEEEMPLAGLVLNRVHGSGAARLSAQRALAAAEVLEPEYPEDEYDESGEHEADAPDLADLADESDRSDESDESLVESSENLAEARIVDHGSGKTGVREATGASPESPPVDHAPEHPIPLEAHHEHTTEELTAGLLRLHAERMQVLAREQRMRDRFTALHPEVAVAHVAALPGDVHDLAGLRAIGEQLAAGDAGNGPTAT
ncbi:MULTISPECIES: ArsA family ATPase [Streptomyces]|uniref:ArsA family ATPase n=1 Tax=Streptomyces tsukubensis (strain DSM 42081 / NBRC 108919 / NRRL 18488 / 9993) TaxID=1114943 RepID=I2N303_STRT9|nr:MULTISPECIES: ArsA family ATPase [Streptomyces]AZK95556.1 anion-transporting ATPase [Streptomyces tsukubensis]EIF91400.1 ion-transporting ATPase [Streptomyces tsukubensis NRRL18488]MYS66656.1 AAA family ATPase [Streptomyces sp. SID5473]QKM68406.1 ArsA family ATPase [Streptomyces tsukubensis NRRL18488]TAI43224.1 ArsA family ATPase [Streptomyces tsukubensis]